MSPLHPLYWWELFKRYPFAVAGGFLTVFLAASNWYIFLDHAQLEADLEGESKTGNEVLENVASSPLIRQQAAGIRAALRYLDGNLIDETNLAENVGYFYALGDKHRVAIEGLQQMSSPTPPTGSPYRAVPFSFRTSGSMSEILPFIRSIESGRYAVKFTRFSFTRREDTPGLIDATFSLTVLGKP
jgi:hypothetical protein